MDKITKELEIGEIHQRDNWQFELKSEFFPLPNLEMNKYTQEFYLFIPNSFQINKQTYSKEDFYKDETNLIRYKTPVFTLKELISPSSFNSPFVRIMQLRDAPLNDTNRKRIEDELKLLGNIFRSTIREESAHHIHLLDSEKMIAFCFDIRDVLNEYREMYDVCIRKWESPLIASYFEYISEYMSNAINHYLVGLLQNLRRAPNSAKLSDADGVISALLIEEKKIRDAKHQEPKNLDSKSEENEYIFYRSSLLNKFVVDALLLDINRASVGKRFSNLIGGISAGVAMLFYLILWVWQGSMFAINSAPFILITVALYILKDRLKESLRNLSFQQASKWFPDYVTQILSPITQAVIGRVSESFSFIPESHVPKDINSIRNQEFHAVFERFKRPERVIYYKRNIEIGQTNHNKDPRRHALNIIFRFSIQQFLAKLANPIHTYTSIDPTTHKFVETQLPKVYHLNIIMKESYRKEDGSLKTKLKKYRLIVDKEGIKRVEQPHFGTYKSGT